MCAPRPSVDSPRRFASVGPQTFFLWGIEGPLDPLGGRREDWLIDAGLSVSSSLLSPAWLPSRLPVVSLLEVFFPCALIFFCVTSSYPAPPPPPPPFSHENYGKVISAILYHFDG